MIILRKLFVVLCCLTLVVSLVAACGGDGEPTTAPAAPTPTEAPAPTEAPTPVPTEAPTPEPEPTAMPTLPPVPHGGAHPASPATDGSTTAAHRGAHTDGDAATGADGSAVHSGSHPGPGGHFEPAPHPCWPGHPGRHSRTRRHVDYRLGWRCCRGRQYRQRRRREVPANAGLWGRAEPDLQDWRPGRSGVLWPHQYRRPRPAGPYRVPPVEAGRKPRRRWGHRLSGYQKYRYRYVQP